MRKQRFIVGGFCLLILQDEDALPFKKFVCVLYIGFFCVFFFWPKKSHLCLNFRNNHFGSFGLLKSSGNRGNETGTDDRLCVAFDEFGSIMGIASPALRACRSRSWRNNTWPGDLFPCARIREIDASKLRVCLKGN